MSFRARLTSFFVLIVVVPMVAMGLLMFRLISDSEQGKADARAVGLATAAGSLYQNQAAVARSDAEALARAVGLPPAAGSLYQNQAAVARSDAEALARAVGSLHGAALVARFSALAR